MKYLLSLEVPGQIWLELVSVQKGGIVLNFSKMNKILELNSANMTARVQPE